MVFPVDLPSSFPGRQGSERFFVRTKVPANRNQSIFFVVHTEKAGAGDRIVFLLRLTFSFSDFVNRRRAQRKALLHRTRRGKNTDALLNVSDCLPVLIPLMPVKAADHLHILFAQFEIEDIIVFCNMIRIGGTGDGNKTCLQLPPKYDLRRRLSVFFCQFSDHCIIEMLGSMAPASERIPTYSCRSVF